jgi:hypothetical protein
MLFSCHESEETAEAYKSQFLTLLSILVAAGTSISQSSLTKFHAIIAIELVASPMMFYVVIYAIRSLFNHRHRLDHLFGHGRLLNRLIAVGTLLMWITLFIYVMLPSDLQQFSQASCDMKSAVVNLTFLAPFRISAAQFQAGGTVASFVIFVPFIAVISSWMSTIYLRREQLWNSAEKCKHPTFWSVWSVMLFSNSHECLMTQQVHGRQSLSIHSLHGYVYDSVQPLGSYRRAEFGWLK